MQGDKEASIVLKSYDIVVMCRECSWMGALLHTRHAMAQPGLYCLQAPATLAQVACPDTERSFPLLIDAAIPLGATFKRSHPKPDDTSDLSGIL